MFTVEVNPVLVASFTLAAAFLLLRRFKQSREKGTGKKYPPSLPVLRLVGSIIRGGMTVLPEHFRKSAEELGPVFSFKAGRSLVVVLNGYEAIYDAMVKHSEAFADRSPLWTEERVINPELRGFSFARYDDVYRKLRKISVSIFKEFGFGVQRISETRIQLEVESMNEEIWKQNGRPFDPKWLTTFATSDVLLSIMFGKNFLQSLPKVHSAIVTNATKCFSNIDLALNMVPLVRFLPVFRRKIYCLRTSGEKLFNAIEIGIEYVKSNNTEPTLVGRFLEIEGPNYDHQDLLYALRDMCFGSTDTVSATLQFAIVELANDPEIQNRFQREIDEMVPEQRLPSLDDKPHLPYTEAVILEVFRRHTVAPLYVPHATLKDTSVLEYDLPKGCMVIANGYSAHMDPAVWGDPENFRPERFLDKDNKIINSKKVIAFGLGKRSCLGEVIGREKTFLFLTSLVQRFDIRPPEGQDSIIVKDVTALTTVPTPFEVRLIPRVKPTQG